ncbi:MAG: NADH-quinone oxidoreductase subunit D [candidate division NC10 bacterium]|nr:NADH-quinone oxidoreductase subunit D [candidate division NC10 bacterium]
MEEMWVNMGPQHPSTHGVLRLLIKLDGEVVRECIPYMGYMHRCHEKIGENRAYVQIIPYTDRLDYLASMYNNWAYCLACERLMGIQIPERAEYLRVLIGELQRIASHLIWLGTFGLDLGNFTLFMWCFREREMVLDLFEAVSGQRLNYSFMRIGGLALDVPEGWLGDVKAFLQWFKPRLPEYDRLSTDNIIWQKRIQGVGILKPEDAVSYACSGPVLRGSGIRWDLRKNDPYGIYDRFEFDIPVGTSGDVWDRFWVRRQEIDQSVRIVEQALKDIPPGPVLAPVAKKLRAPVGDIYSRVESPRGELGDYIIADGSEKPYRYKVRAPTFVNLSALPVMLPGYLVADAVAVLGSVDIVLCEVDR